MTCKNNFGADAPSQPIPVLKGRVCGRVSIFPENLSRDDFIPPVRKVAHL
jgi:hypothetical protein